MHLVYIHNTIVEWPLAHYRMGKLDCIILITRPEPEARRKIAVNPVHTRSVEVTSVCLQINKLINSKKLHNYWDALQTKTREKNFCFNIQSSISL